MKASRVMTLAAVILGALGATGSARAAAELKCAMTFRLTTWSILYKSAIGTGVIHCANGQALRVKLRARGGGLTAGLSEEAGRGEFSPVSHLEELLGGYAQLQAHAGAVRSVQAQVMTKGAVSLALWGKGRGWSLGVDVGELKIER